MSQHEIKISQNGERLYRGGHRYTPVSPEERVYAVRQPDDPRAVRWYGQWFLPLEVLPDEAREMPATRPYRDARSH